MMYFPCKCDLAAQNIAVSSVARYSDYLDLHLLLSDKQTHSGRLLKFLDLRRSLEVDSLSIL